MRSILFKPKMYHATVTKKVKTETRRVHGLSEVNKAPNEYKVENAIFLDSGNLSVLFHREYEGSPRKSVLIKSRFKKGEILYIAEPMYIFHNEQVYKDLSLGKMILLDVPHLYKYDLNIGQLTEAANLVKSKTWKVVSPMLMRQQYGRRFIRILDISIERLQDISRSSILNEGVIDLSSMKPGEKIADDLLKIMYATLFDEINGAGSWNKNLFVFAYSYEYLPDYKRRLAND